MYLVYFLFHPNCWKPCGQTANDAFGKYVPDLVTSGLGFSSSSGTGLSLIITAMSLGLDSTRIPSSNFCALYLFGCA